MVSKIGKNSCIASAVLLVLLMFACVFLAEGVSAETQSVDTAAEPVVEKAAEAAGEKQLQEEQDPPEESGDPGDFVLLLVNDFIDANGELTEFGKLIEENIVKNNRNVRLVLCGNAEGTATWEKTYGERKVTALMYNYTADEENGIGFVRILSFNSKDQTIKVDTVNPFTDVTEYDEKHPEKDHFIIDKAF